jgi:hypothetical protein
MMHDFKWTAFLDGPVFLCACIFEAKKLVEIETAQGDPDYNGDSKMKRDVFRALIIYCFTVFA